MTLFWYHCHGHCIYFNTELSHYIEMNLMYWNELYRTIRWCKLIFMFQKWPYFCHRDNKSQTVWIFAKPLGIIHLVIFPNSSQNWSFAFLCMKMYEFVHNISLRFVPKPRINNIPALVQIMVWHRPMMVSFLTHICVTRPQRVIGKIFLLSDAVGFLQRK